VENVEFVNKTSLSDFNLSGGLLDLPLYALAALPDYLIGV
jgi:hypothetical protein